MKTLNKQSQLEMNSNGRNETKLRNSEESRNGDACCAPSPQAQRFAELLQAGIEAWIEAGKFYVAQTNINPAFGRELMAAYPHITGEMLAAFDRIGRGLVNPKLLLCDNRPGVKALLSRPLVEQNEFENNPIEVAIGFHDVEKIKVRDLTQAQVRQVFGRDGIRTIQQQKQYLFDKERKKKPFFEIVGDKVLVAGKIYLSAQDLKNMLTELEKA